MKQTYKEWYLKVDNFMMRNGFTRHESIMFDYSYIILVLNVDDVLLLMINELRRQLTREFKKMNLGVAKLYKVFDTVNLAIECANVFTTKRNKKENYSMYLDKRKVRKQMTIKLQKTAPVCTIMPAPFPSCYWKYLQLRGEMGGKHEA
ncbi:hypothetical protein LXL04_002972 [Taraxacum kok-saghyz]